MTEKLVFRHDKLHRWFENFSPHAIDFLSLVALVLISVITNYIIPKELYFPQSYALTALVIGLGCAYLGWQLDTPSLSDSDRFRRVVVASISICFLLIIVLLIDQVLLYRLNTDRKMVFDIPTIHIEVTPTVMSLKKWAYPKWVYGLFVMFYSVFIYATSRLLHTVYLKRQLT
jgi:hypothetical protein